MPRRKSPTAPVSVLSAGDDEIAVLTALRNRLAAAIDNPETPVKDLSPLARRFQEVDEKLRERREQTAKEAAVQAAAQEDEGAYTFDPEDL